MKKTKKIARVRKFQMTYKISNYEKNGVKIRSYVYYFDE